MTFRGGLALLAALFAMSELARAGERSLDARLHHLRVAGEREWSDFPAMPEGPRLLVSFRGEQVEVRRLDILIPVAADVRDALVVREDDEHVGPVGGSDRGGEREQCAEREQAGHVDPPG